MAALSIRYEMDPATGLPRLVAPTDALSQAERHALELRLARNYQRLLEVGQDTLGLRREVRLELDVTTFETLVAEGPETAGRALSLYRGDLAEGLGHECFAADRERVSDLYEDALAAVAEARLAADDVKGARQAATLLLARDPLREEAHSVLIAAYGMVGSRSQVVRQYRRLCDILRT